MRRAIAGLVGLALSYQIALDYQKASNVRVTDLGMTPPADYPASAVAAPAVTQRYLLTGAWDIATNRSAIDDTEGVTIWVKSNQLHRGRFGRSGRLELVISCYEKKTAVYVTFAGEYMASFDSHGDVTYRVDDRPAKTRRFRESNDNTALGLWSGGEAIPFIKELLGRTSLIVRATPYNETSVEAEFPIRAVEVAIAPLRKACGWPDPKAAPASNPATSTPPARL